MEGMIGELKISDLMGSTSINVQHPGVYIEEVSAASEDGDGFVVGADGRIETKTHNDAEPETAAARTKADILIESVAPSEQSPADSFDFVDPAPQPDGGDEDGTIVWELGEGAYRGTGASDSATGLETIDIEVLPETDTDLAVDGNALIISEDS